jgi:hypothetical protein
MAEFLFDNAGKLGKHDTHQRIRRPVDVGKMWGRWWGIKVDTKRGVTSVTINPLYYYGSPTGA